MAFQKIPGFCQDCGSIFPPLRENRGITCYGCSREFPADNLSLSKVHYTIVFNARDAKTLKTEPNNDEDEIEGPVVDRKCPKCGNETMSYATVQLRSADEGQTVFFTCTKCKYKESENS